MIIFLNGASSSGKTSLARALQEVWNDPLLYWSLDAVISQLPLSLTGEGIEARRGFPIVSVSTEEGPKPAVAVGSIGRDLTVLSAQYIRSLAEMGYDAVVDYVLLDDEMYEALKAQLTEVETVFVGVTCDPITLSEREKARGDRVLGLSAYQEQYVHSCQRYYDLELDSTNLSPKHLASKVVDYIADNEITTGLGKSI